VQDKQHKTMQVCPPFFQRARGPTVVIDRQKDEHVLLFSGFLYHGKWRCGRHLACTKRFLKYGTPGRVRGEINPNTTVLSALGSTK
jgi:hypothetical protein